MFGAVLRKINQAWSKYQLKEPEYQYLFEPAPDDDWVCFDCETTGLDTKHDKIISLSAIKIRGHQILTSETLNLKFKQQKLINPESIVIHHLRNIDAQAGLDELDAMREFLAFVGARPLVGYYLEFDVAMVNAVIKPWLGINLPNQQTDIATFYSKLFAPPFFQPEHEVFDLSLNAMLKKCDVPALSAHDAFNDALMTAMLCVKMQSLIKRR